MTSKTDAPKLSGVPPTTHPYFKTEDVSDALVASNDTVKEGLADESTSMKNLNNSLPGTGACATLGDVATQTEVEESAALAGHAVVLFDQNVINSDTDPTTVSHAHGAFPPSQFKGQLQGDAPLRSDEPPYIARVQSQLVAFASSNPDSQAETFDDMSIPKPAECTDARVWLAMFKFGGLGNTRNFTCYACGKSLSRPERAIAHWREHLNHRPYKCEGSCGNLDCQDRFFGPEPLQAHIYRKKLGKTKCPHCHRMYDKRNFSKHPGRCPKGQSNVSAGESSASDGEHGPSRSTRSGGAYTIRKRTNLNESVTVAL